MSEKPKLDYARPRRSRHLRATHYVSATVSGVSAFAFGGFLTAIAYLYLFGLPFGQTLWKALAAVLAGAALAATGTVWLQLRSFDGERRHRP